MKAGRAVVLVAAACAFPAPAEDWPEWRGRDRRGLWNEPKSMESFPESGLPLSWSAPVRAGYAGPAVAGGRVFVTDYAEGVERALCYDEATGALRWTREWPADYRGLGYATGPRATPTVDGDRVYVLGAKGRLACLRVRDGAVVWEKDFARDFNAEIPGWGTANAPLVDGKRLIAVVGGRPAAKVVAFDKMTGRELWRSLSGEESEPGYSQPILIEAGGARQLIVWHAGAVSSLDPESGRVWWEHPFRVHMNTPIATPVYSAPYLIVSGFFNGARMFALDRARPRAELRWSGQSQSEVRSDALHALMAAPVIDGDYLYGICSYGQLRCLRVDTGERVWESQQVTVERARNVSAHIIRVPQGYLFWNDRGELVAGYLRPEGYQEISRVKLLDPTSPPGGRRQLGAVNWTHPAFANGHIIVRNDREMKRYRLLGAGKAVTGPVGR